MYVYAHARARLLDFEWRE